MKGLQQKPSNWQEMSTGEKLAWLSTESKPSSFKEEMEFRKLVRESAEEFIKGLDVPEEFQETALILFIAGQQWQKKHSMK